MKKLHLFLFLAIQFSYIQAQNLTGVKIFINPGHGGFDSNDRNVVIAPYTSGDKSTEIAKNLYANEITTWSSGYQVRGDKTFARTIMGWSDGYGVLRGLAVPGVISEGTMHDYIPETYRLMNLDYKWLEAWNFYKSFCNYFNGGQISTGVIAGQVRDSRIKNDATYNKFAGNDQMLPLNGAKLTLVETNEVYTCDNMQNGVFVFKNLAQGTYHVKAEKEGYHTQTVEVAVTAHNISYKNFALNRIRNTPPQVLSYSPNVAITDSVEASSSISLSFNWDMDIPSTEQAFSISPSVAGKFTWEDTNYRLRFTPDKPLEKSTVYTVTLNKSASHPDNLSMAANFTFQFRTKSRNRLSLIAAYPFDGSNKVYFNNPSFRLIFDKKLNTSNLSTSIRVLDENNSVLAKATRSVINNSIISPYGSMFFNLAANLVPEKEYTLVIDGDVSDETGIKMVEPINIKFKASSTLVTSHPVVETFDNVMFDYDANRSNKTLSASVSLSSTILFGTGSNKISVTDFPLNEYAYFNLTHPITVDANKIVGWHINGDLSGSSIELICKAESDERFIKLCNLNFQGWEYHELEANNLDSNKTYELTGIRIKRESSWLFNATTNVLFDNLLIYDKSTMALAKLAANHLIAYPNPATTMVKVDAPVNEETSLGLYALNGVLLHKVNDNKMNVSNFISGTYILKLKTKNYQLVCPLIIAR